MAKETRSIDVEVLRGLLDYDPKSGVLTWKHRQDARPQWNAKCAGKIAGSLNKSIGYVTLRIFDKAYYAHRVAYALMTGEWPKNGIDHINGDRKDNRWDNLRPANQSQNMMNRRKSAKNSTGYKGVCYDKTHKVYVADIRANGKSIRIGRYATPEEAHAAYCKASADLHGDFSRVA